MTNSKDNLELKAVQVILAELTEFSPEQRDRVLRTVVAFFGDNSGPRLHAPSASQEFFSADRTITPKDFLQQKRPETDIDRIACLAYYLAHYRDMPSFKTADLSQLNTEAAQRKFANASFAANNALKAGLLAPATKGARQLSAAGEEYVQALPDRDAARSTMASSRRRGKRKRSTRQTARKQ